MAIPAGIAELEDEMIALRHRIHAQPELAYEEFATGDLVAERLQEWGYTVHRGLGRTGGGHRRGGDPDRLAMVDRRRRAVAVVPDRDVSRSRGEHDEQPTHSQ